MPSKEEATEGAVPGGVRDYVLKLVPWLVDIRRDFHQYPELKYQERRTGEKISKLLEEWGIRVKRGLAETGVVGIWESGREGPVIAMRADMDALPICEEGDRPYASKNPGVMHACGHDAHVSMLLGAARIIANCRPLKKGTVKFVFQPAEEGGGGGLRMVQEGVLEDPKVDLVLAFHVFPTLRVGEVGVTTGPALASVDDFVVRIRGKGGHAAHPHMAKDPILAGASLVQEIQSIVSRGTDPLDSLVVSVTRFQAGTAFNVIPEEAELWGTVRALKEEVRAYAHTSLQEKVEGVAKAHGVEATLEVRKGYPVLENDPQVVSLVEEVAIKFLGQRNVLRLPPSMGSEDFSYFLKRCPGAFVVLGCSSPHGGQASMLHSPNFDIDEGVLPIGVELWLRLAEAYLGQEEKVQST